MEIRAYAIKERGDVATPFAYQRTLGDHDVLVRITHRSVGSRSDAVEMLAFAATHNILPNVDIVPFARLHEAIQRIRSRDVTTALVLES